MRLEQTKARIEEIIGDENLNLVAKIVELKKMYALVRGEQRAATESAMVVDDNLGAMQVALEKAFERLGTRAPAPEDRGAATL